MSARSICIIGAGGHGREMLDILRAADPDEREWRFAGFVADDEPDMDLLDRLGAAWLGSTDAYRQSPLSQWYVIGVGDPGIRRRLAGVMAEAGLQAATLIHPTATIGSLTRLGPGSVVWPHASLSTNVQAGRHAHFNQASSTSHDCVIGDFVTVCPQATLSGAVTIEADVWVGVGATVIQGLTVSRGTLVGAGAVVTRDLPANVVATGVPARARAR